MVLQKSVGWSMPVRAAPDILERVGTQLSYAPGSFAWVDLRTTDLSAAKRFYTGLFGWSYSEFDDGYAAAVVDGDAVAGLKVLAEDQPAPFWLTYVAVADADTAAARTRQLGGTVHKGPFDSGAGRVAVIADPTGGTLCLMQSSKRHGACRVDDPGCLAWHELSTDDVPTASRFYTDLLGWRIEPADRGPYWKISHDTVANGGMREQGQTIARWRPYFAVASLNEALTYATGAGGRAVAGPHNTDTGGFAILRDPQGAEFGVMEGQFG